MKIAIIGNHVLSPIPTLNGGAVEFLITLLLENYEKDEKSEHQIFLIQENKNENTILQAKMNFKKTKFIYVNHNKKSNILRGCINRLIRLVSRKSRDHFIPFTYHKQIFNQVKTINPDVIIFENYKDPLLNKYAKYFGKNKVYIHIHNDFAGAIFFNINQNVGLISVSEFIEKPFFINNKNLNAYVLANCANDTFLQNISYDEKLALRNELGFSKDDFVIIYCGRIIKEKGVLQLMQAVLNTPNHIKLMVIGEIGVNTNHDKVKNLYVEKVRELARANPGKIKFTGYINNEDLYKYYQSANLQVVPTLVEEAAGIVVIEGQMSRLPQIITRSGGMVEYATSDTIIIERDSDLVKNLSEAIIKLSLDVTLLNAMSESSKKNATKYTREIYYQNFLRIISDIEKQQKSNKGEVNEEKM